MDNTSIYDEDNSSEPDDESSGEENATNIETYENSGEQNIHDVNQTNEKLFISCNNLLNVTIQSHPTKDGCYMPNKKCLIVARINPISCCCPVHHGTFFEVLID